MKNLIIISLLSLIIASSCQKEQVSDQRSDQKEEQLKSVVTKSVRVVWLKPTDVPYNQDIVDAIKSGAEHVKDWWSQYNNGKAFRLNDPVVEVINGDHSASWYVNTPAGPWGSLWYWWENSRLEVKRKLGTSDWDMNYRVFIYVSVDKPSGGSGASLYGYAVVDNQDIYGLLGQSQEPVLRWYGGFAHELGHCFDLPDETTSGCVMSGALYNYPACNFCNPCKNILATSSRNVGFFTDGPPPGNHVAWIYQHCSYGGYEVGLESGNYTMSQLQALGLANDDASSLKLSSGYQITLYQHDNYSGYSFTLDANDDCLTDNTEGRGDGTNWNDDISSAKVEATGIPSETIDFNSVSIVSFSNQDSDGSYTVLDGGATLHLQNNTWKRTSGTYAVTSNTVLEFEFMSNDEGEIHGIGLDEDNSLSSNRIFKVYGSQNWGRSNYDNYSTPGTYKTYQIPVGQFYTGSTMYLVFVNDNDGGSGNTSYFKNIRLYEN